MCLSIGASLYKQGSVVSQTFNVASVISMSGTGYLQTETVISVTFEKTKLESGMKL